MISFSDHHGARLLRMAPTRVVPALGEVLSEAAQTIAEDAAFSIKDGAISGPGHVPSLPGEPPSADTHDLDQSIHVGELIELGHEIRTSVIADSDHAWIERGGANLAPRPYMEPATERARPNVVAALGKRYVDEVNG